MLRARPEECISFCVAHGMRPPVKRGTEPLEADQALYCVPGFFTPLVIPYVNGEFTGLNDMRALGIPEGYRRGVFSLLALGDFNPEVDHGVALCHLG